MQRKNVYNISAMSKKRAEEILSAPTLPCLQIARAQDGRLIHDECPVWLKPLRNSWRKTLGIAISLLTLFFACGSQTKAQSQQKASKDNTERVQKEDAYAIASRNAGLSSADLKQPQAFTRLNFRTWIFQKKILPLSISDKFTQEQIDAIDGKKIELDAVPPQLDKTAWELFFKARKLHLKASMRFVNKEIGKATKECQE